MFKTARYLKPDALGKKPDALGTPAKLVQNTARHDPLSTDLFGTGETPLQTAPEPTREPAARPARLVHEVKQNCER